MTEANPFRSNELAAQERIVELERELTEKNKLIYKLKNPKPKKPRRPINWPKWLKTTAKILTAVIGGAVCILFFIALLEPNDRYVAKGKIIKVLNKEMVYNKICKKPDENGKIREVDGSACADNELNRICYTVMAEFNDRYHGMRTAKHTSCAIPFLYQSIIPYVGCKVDVYYNLGSILKDENWSRINDPTIDINDCQK